MPLLRPFGMAKVQGHMYCYALFCTIEANIFFFLSFHLGSPCPVQKKLHTPTTSAPPVTAPPPPGIPIPPPPMPPRDYQHFLITFGTNSLCQFLSPHTFC